MIYLLLAVAILALLGLIVGLVWNNQPNWWLHVSGVSMSILLGLIAGTFTVGLLTFFQRLVA